MLEGPKNASATGQNAAAEHEATDIYFVVNKMMKNSAIAIKVIRQSTNQIVANPVMNALPPLNLYQTGKQWPIIQNKPEN